MEKAANGSHGRGWRTPAEVKPRVPKGTKTAIKTTVRVGTRDEGTPIPIDEDHPAHRPSSHEAQIPMLLLHGEASVGGVEKPYAALSRQKPDGEGRGQEETRRDRHPSPPPVAKGRGYSHGWSSNYDPTVMSLSHEHQAEEPL